MLRDRYLSGLTRLYYASYVQLLLRSIDSNDEGGGSTEADAAHIQQMGLRLEGEQIITRGGVWLSKKSENRSQRNVGTIASWNDPCFLAVFW